MKFWTSEDEIKRFRKAREKKFTTGPDHEVYLHIGLFTNAYALVEMRLTLLLAKATKIDNLQSFDLLVRGMDVKVKIERLRRACERGTPLGKNLNARLAILDEHMRPLRNKIAHTYTVPNPEKTAISFTTLAAIPEFTENRHPDAVEPDSIDMLELFECSAWLLLLNRDLRDAHRAVSRLGMFEIENPRTPLLPGSGPSPGQPKRAAKPGRRERKRQRKGQPPRGKGV